MFIYNTTFNCEISCYKEFVQWVRETYIPQALSYEGVSNPRLARIFGEDDSQNMNISIQFNTPGLEELSQWYNHCGANILQTLQEKYGEKVAGFSTIMEEIEL